MSLLSSAAEGRSADAWQEERSQIFCAAVCCGFTAEQEIGSWGFFLLLFLLLLTECWDAVH